MEKQQINIHTYYIGLLVVLFLSASFFVVIQHSLLKKTNSPPKLVAKKVLPISAPTVTPTATPSAIPSPTPTYSGFCIRVPVLTYHHIEPQDQAKAHGQTSLNVDPSFFDQQMAAVSSRYTTISAQQLVDGLRTHTSLPGNAMVITIDDGYEDVFTYAYPILQKYHITTSLFIPTGLLGITGNNSYFDWGQLGQMVNTGYIFAYDHTWSHYPVGSGSQEKDQYEIMTAKQQLESHLGKTVTLFANPYGSGSNNPRVIALLKQDGFTGAFSTIPGIIQCDSSIYFLHRTRIGNASLASYGL